MCNEETKKLGAVEEYDYRFIDYRLTQLETNLKNGQKKLEEEQQGNYRELLNILQAIQEGNNTQNQKLIELNERQKTSEEKLACIDKLREVATKHNTEIHELERRLEIYKQVLFVIGTGVAIALITEILHLV